MDYRSGCPISNLVDLVGDKWSLLIVRDFFLERNTFKQFMDSPEGIAQQQPAQQLQMQAMFM